MSTIVTIASGDLISNSRTDINGNFTALNNEKIETSYIDTDTALTNNSDVRIPSQKAVKAYVDAGGNVNASTTTKGIVEEATAAEVAAGTAAGGTGARLYINPSTLSSILKFGGTGVDGALTITSGATNINCAGASVVIKNYTSISITGTASLTFTNPAATGTIIILKSQGNVTITTSTNPAIDLRSMGGVLGAGGGVNTAGTAGAAGAGSPVSCGGGGGGSVSGGVSGGGIGGTSIGLSSIFFKSVSIACGAGGGGGGGENQAGGGGGGGGASASGIVGGAFSVGGNASGGGGGNGGGALYIECVGALNITSTINASGGNGSNGTGTVSGGGGGGGAGSIIILYVTLTANSGTYTVAAGTGGSGAGGGGNGGAGGVGMSIVAANTEIV